MVLPDRPQDHCSPVQGDSEVSGHRSISLCFKAGVCGLVAKLRLMPISELRQVVLESFAQVADILKAL